MRLTIIDMSLLNFKGHTIFIPFSRNTLILGKNGSGKTTVYDAFLWLLFGKDSIGRTDYNIKPRLLDGSEVQKMDVSVLGRFDLDGKELTLERRFVEKWTKKRGSEEAEFTGNATEFAINGVGCNASNFKAKIDTIVNEEHFRLITSSTYFNSLKWDKRRELILKAAGEPTNEDVASGNEAFQRLLSYLSGKSLDELRKELAAKKKPIKKELDEIPSRIDETKKNIIVKDWVTIVALLNTQKEELRSLENQLTDENLRIQEENKDINVRIQGLYQDINDLERRKMDIESKHKLGYNKELSNLSSQKEQTRQEIGMASQELERLNFNIEANTRSKEEVLTLLRKLGAQYKAIASGDITGEDRICPTCGQEFTDEYLNDRTAHLLEDINKKGEENDLIAKSFDKKIIESQGRIKELEMGRDRLQEKLADLERATITHFVTSCNEDEEYKTVIKSIASKREDVELLSGSIVQPNDLSGVKDRINTLKKEIDSLNREIAEKTSSDKAMGRIGELEAQEKKLSSSLASLEKTEMVAERFIHKKMDMMTERINSMFSLVKWKMFESQINGGEKEICECEIDGVPFGSLNTAKKVNAGLDIANTFSYIYNVYAPIFCDNRESVTDLIDVEAQVISLIVSPEHKALTIKNQ